ncbi:MAG TPA: methyltransferase domain-containing protein [Marmoricola sp.]
MTSSYEPPENLARLYPEMAAGGFSRRDGFIEFYLRVNALLTPESHVLDFGAGRGVWADPGELAPTHVQLRSFHERVAEVVGIDPDPIVAENPTLARGIVVAPGESLPFDDESFDLVLADYVLEHVDHEDAPQVAAEITRVLKPGGWFAARTPYKWGMIALAARAVPNRLHSKLLERLQPGRQERDVFPTRYAMNTRRDLRRLFPDATHRRYLYNHTSEPTYFGTSTAASRVAGTIGRLTPPPLEPTLMAFIQKR